MAYVEAIAILAGAGCALAWIVDRFSWARRHPGQDVPTNQPTEMEQP